MWVFGAVDLQMKEFFIQIVLQRDAATLLPIIQGHIRPGSRIWSMVRRGLYGSMSQIGKKISYAAQRRGSKKSSMSA